ncbi:MAG: HNH endonuclease [Steroidobacter sp.]
MSDQVKWTRKQLLVAFALYCQLPFGKLHSRNSEISRYAKLIGRTSSALAMKLTNIASLDPVIKESGRKGLSKASKTDKELWDEIQQDWQGFVEKSQLILSELGIEGDDEIPIDEREIASYEGKTKQIQVNIRIGQNFFRRAVLSAYQSTCCISGLANSGLLVASHIVPWRTDPKNRLNPKNGLCLSVLHDRAFDLGLITISKKMTVQVSKKLLKSKDTFLETSLLSYADAAIKLPEKFGPDEIFLEYHREKIFAF